MKKNNLWHIIWIIGIYSVLITVLYLVVIYKVKWENKDLNDYVYFYNCGNNLCTSNSILDNYYGKVICDDNGCPYIKEIHEENVILSNDNHTWIYNYVNDFIVSNQYIDYRYLDNNFYVVTNEDNKQGIIDTDGNIIVELNYNYIKAYNEKYLVYKENNLYGITSIDKSVTIDAQYDDIILINDDIYSYKKDGYYYISNYNDTLVNNKKYNYVYSYNNIILVVYDKKIDITDSKLNTLLLMKLNTTYEYSNTNEINSLNIYHDLNNIYFSVYNSNKEYNKYTFDILDYKLR